MVEVSASLPRDEAGRREAAMHAIVDRLVIEKSNPDSRHDARSKEGIPEDREQQAIKDQGNDQAIPRMHQYFVRIAWGRVMREVRCIHHLAQSRIRNRDLDVKHESVQGVLQERPDQNTGRHEPEQITAVCITAREIQKKKCEKRKNPEGAKTYQPLTQFHAYILPSRRTVEQWLQSHILRPLFGTNRISGFSVCVIHCHARVFALYIQDIDIYSEVGISAAVKQPFCNSLRPDAFKCGHSSVLRMH